jgi:eukaryotic-like serine/threonine-protein kinase
MNSSSSSEQDSVDRLAEEFVARHRRGEHPELAEYTQRFPQYAEAIRDLFPALVLIERVKPGDGEPTGDYDAMAASQGRRLERLGDYRILREIGRGGMGVVYEAEQESLGRRVALKVLSAGALIDPQQVRRFEREAPAAAKLHHTNIVPVFGVGQQDGHHYYVMQLIPGLGSDLVLEDLHRLRHPEASPKPAGRDRHEPSERPAARSRSGLTAAEVAR